MERILNFQISLFGSFLNIKPQAELILKLLTNLQVENYIPSTVDIALMDTTTKKISSDSRLQMVSQEKRRSIVFLQDRIDFNYGANLDCNPIKNVRVLVEQICSDIEKTFSVFPSTVGNRLAVNGKFLLDKKTEEELRGFISQYTNIPSFFADEDLTEWNIRINSRGALSTSDANNEICNRIVDLGIASLASQDNKRICLGVDLNTAPDNTTMRFKYTDLIYFANHVVDFICSTLAEIEGT